MEKDGREGVFQRSRLEEEEVAIGEQAADDFGARGSVEAKAQVAHGDFAVVADAHGSAEAPDETPPGAEGSEPVEGQAGAGRMPVWFLESAS